jgi:hypothetical protein
MAHILRRVPPIEDVFDPNDEVRTNLRRPRQEREGALKNFREKWPVQMMAWALCRRSIEEAVEANPDLSREEMVTIIHEFANHYGFAPAYVLEAESLVRDYTEMHERVKKLGKEYKDDKIGLIKRLTGLEFPKHDEDDFEIREGPAAFEIFCSGTNAQRIYNNSMTDNEGCKYGGFAQKTEEGFFVVVINKDFNENIIELMVSPHERRHVIFGIVDTKIVGRSKMLNDVRSLLQGNNVDFLSEEFEFDQNLIIELCNRYQFENDAHTKAIILEVLMRIAKYYALEKVRDEIFAYKSQPLKHINHEKLPLLFQPGSTYDYLEILRKLYDDPLWQETAQKMLVDEYRQIIYDAIEAFDQLVESGYSRFEAIAFLGHLALPEWPKFVKRLLKYRGKISKQ